MIGKNKINNRGQITIFIILAMIIVVGIVIFFILIRKPGVEIQDVENPQAYIDSCTREFTEEAINILSEQGGDINPKVSVMYQGKNITYLCYTGIYYTTCVNQRPLLIEYIENEITNYISPKVENCFASLKSKLEQKNYIIEMGDMQLTTALQPGMVVINIDRSFKMTKRDETRSFDKFKSSLTHPIYDLAKIAMEITNQEAKYCNFNDVGFMMIYPNYDITKFRTSYDDNIYTVGERNTNKKFTFAISSCSMPGGLI